MKALAAITDMTEVIAYAKAELSDAQKKCPCSAPEYQKAVQIGIDAQASWFDDEQAVQKVKDQIYAARKHWYDVCKCGEPAGQATVPVYTDPIVEGGGDGGTLRSGMGTSGWLWLIVGLGAAAYFLYGKKKPGEKKPEVKPAAK